jgi:DNA-binding CsgD family transcriptional regulator
MSQHGNDRAALTANAIQPLPLSTSHWSAIVQEMGLSYRQAQIAELMARGAQLKEIAALLKISISTVRTQQARIYAKLGVSGRGELLIQILALSHQVSRCPCHAS